MLKKKKKKGGGVLEKTFKYATGNCEAQPVFPLVFYLWLLRFTVFMCVCVCEFSFLSQFVTTSVFGKKKTLLWQIRGQMKSV